MSSFLRADWGQGLESGARAAAVPVAAVIAAGAVTYELGAACRRWLDRLNDATTWSAANPAAAAVGLLAAAVALIGWLDGLTAAPAVVPAVVLQRCALAAPPAVIHCPPLDSLRVADLRRLARSAGLSRDLSRSGRRADLLAALAA